MQALIYEREPSAFKYPYAFDVPLDSWHELVMANALYDQAGFVLLSDVHQLEHVRALEARAGQGRQGGDVPPAPRPHVGQEAVPPTRPRRRRCRRRLDWMFILTLEWFGLPDERKRHGIQLEYGFKGKTNDELRQDWMGDGRAVHGGGRARRARRTATSDERWVIDCPFPRAFDAEAKRWGDGDHLGRGAWSAGRAAGR